MVCASTYVSSINTFVDIFKTLQHTIIDNTTFVMVNLYHIMSHIYEDLLFKEQLFFCLLICTLKVIKAEIKI